MRSIEDKKLCYQESNSGLGFEFHHKGNNIINTNNVVGANNNNNSTARSSANSHSHRSTALGKLSAPSKWDDAQKWLVGLSRGGSGERNQSQNKPRNSNADDLRLIAPVPQKEQEEYYSSEEDDDDDDDAEENGCALPKSSSITSITRYNHEAEKTKNVDVNNKALWRINKPIGVSNSAVTVVRSVCVRDMGTEMTPIASQEPSRTATPVRATTPVVRSPLASGSSTPIRSLTAQQTSCPLQTPDGPSRGHNSGSSTRRCVEDNNNNNNNSSDHNQVGNLNPLETRAVAWDEAERAKYMARYKREEVKIQAWENHEKRKAEMEMKKMEVKAERIKARAEEKMANKLAATRRIAEEKRANAEAELNEKAVRTSEKADYIRRTGHLPSSFSFKLPSLCW